MAGPRFKGIPVDDAGGQPPPSRPRFGGGILVEDVPQAAAAQVDMVPSYDPMGSYTGGMEPAAQASRADQDTMPLAIVRGARQGLTLGFGDEAIGALSGVGAVLHGEPYQPAYDASVAETRRLMDESSKAHPYAYGAGQIAGGVTAAIPMMVAAPTAFGVAPGMSLGARTLWGGGSGLALGGTQGLGEGQGSVLERKDSAFAGAALGGGFGLAGPLVGKAASAGVNEASKALAARGISIPGLGNRAANTLTDAVAASPAGQIEGRLAELGPNAVLADGSPALGALTQGLASRPEGAARNTIVQGLAGRDEGTNARIAANLVDNLGPAPVPSQIERQFAGIRQGAGRLYGEALSNANPIDTTGVLSTLGARINTAEGAERAALIRARDMLMPQRGPGGSRIMQTDARNLHAVKEELDRLIQYGDPQMGIPRGAFSSPDSALFGVRRGLNDALEAQVPRYADANLMARTAHGASEALESGRNALRPDVHPVDYAAAFDAAPIEGQAAARLGMRADIDRAVGNQANDLQALRGVIKGEGDWNRAKMAQTFGPEAADQTAAGVEREIAFRGLYNDAVRGSQTANKGLAAEAVGVRTPKASRTDTDIAIGSMLGGPGGAGAAVAVRAGRWGLGTIGRRSDISRNEQIAEALMRANPQALLSSLGERAAARLDMSPARQDAVARISAALIGASDRNSDNRLRFMRFIGAH